MNEETLYRNLSIMCSVEDWNKKDANAFTMILTCVDMPKPNSIKMFFGHIQELKDLCAYIISLAEQLKDKKLNDEINKRFVDFMQENTGRKIVVTEHGDVEIYPKVETKFKIGDRIRHKKRDLGAFIITDIKDYTYCGEQHERVSVFLQDEYELVK